MIYYKDHPIEFMAERNTTLYGVTFKKDDIIQVVLNRDWSHTDGLGAGGPWGWGGYTIKLIKSIARRIVDSQRGVIIYGR